MNKIPRLDSGIRIHYQVGGAPGAWANEKNKTRSRIRFIVHSTYIYSTNPYGLFCPPFFSRAKDKARILIVTEVRDMRRCDNKMLCYAATAKSKTSGPFFKN